MTATLALRVADFDALPAGEAVEVLLSCARIPGWAEMVAAGRPYEQRDRLIGTAKELARRWTWPEVAGALAAHPRIGERPRGAGSEAAMSRSEQSGVSGELADELRAVNEAYEQRFGRVLLVRAAGRTASDVLRIGVRRLLLDEATDQAITTAELRDIALRRLRGLIA